MKRYLLYGPNGVGKSAIGIELKSRGYFVIEADHHEGLSSWVNKHTGLKVEHKPPFTKKWLDNHEWRWDEATMNKILGYNPHATIFVVGGAHNMNRFMNRFDKRFFIYTDFDRALQRLKIREPQRWLDGSAEVERLRERLSQGTASPEKNSKDKVIDNSGSIAEAADEIINDING